MTDITLTISGCWDDRLSIVIHLKDEYETEEPGTMVCEEAVSQMEGTPNYGKDDETVSFERPLTRDEADLVKSVMSDFLVPAIPVTSRMLPMIPVGLSLCLQP